ncbi:hypothetical protein BDY19DRAFT_585011 [Irpex rosettiformis]|uniref:Uncharacterized protein n=1 Tax=Irpex rosettiformis TaxID=378272 RepID=A0ACB8UCX3_9APHY|nr:hypothetical protein BDY19DRAFT_585011 [Irpex rosettiformis]
MSVRSIFPLPLPGIFVYHTWIPLSFTMSNITVDASVPLVPGSLMWQTVFNATSAALVGSWFALLLCGIAIAQGYNYFNNCSGTNIWTRILVFLVSFLNILHILFVCIAEYTHLVSNSGDLVTRLMASWALLATIECHIILATIVLMYYTGICFHLLTNKKLQKPMVALLFVTILVHFSCGTATVVKMSEHTSRLDMASYSKPIVIPMVVTQVVADVLVTATLCFALPKPSAKSFSRTRDAIQTIMCFFVSRGIVTSLVAIVELVLLIVSYHNLWFIASEYMVGGLYTNSLLAALNARNHIHSRLRGTSVIATPMSIPLDIRHSNGSNEDSSVTGATSIPPNGRVKVEVYTFQKCDDSPEACDKIKA